MKKEAVKNCEKKNLYVNICNENNCVYFRCIKTVILVWLDSYPDDFHEPPNFPCLTSLIAFAKKFMSGSEVVNKANKAIENLCKVEELSRPIKGV